MNYDRIKTIFIDLYEELCNTFDAFESDFSIAINQEVTCESSLYPGQNAVSQYFESITVTKDAACDFITKLLAPAVIARNKFDVSSSYHYVLAKETLASQILIGRDRTVNYSAFIKKLSIDFGLTKKDVHELIRKINATN
jgi:hypothetical protein